MTGGEALLGWRGYDDEEKSTMRRATSVGYAFLVALALGYAWLATVTSTEQTPIPQPCSWRTCAMCALMMGMLVQLYADNFKMPGCTKDQEVFPLLRMIGKPVFLTQWILCLQSVHNVAGAASEVALFLGSPLPWLTEFNYKAAIFVDTIGIMLTLLFLKFNYFEEKWVVEVVQLWESRGNTTVAFWSLVGHVLSLPIAILDVVVRSPSYLEACKPPLLVNVGCATVLAFSYVGWIHIWWAASGFKCWPYPFLHEFGTCVKRLIFVVVISVAMSLLMVGVNLLP